MTVNNSLSFFAAVFINYASAKVLIRSIIDQIQCMHNETTFKHLLNDVIGFRKSTILILISQQDFEEKLRCLQDSKIRLFLKQLLVKRIGETKNHFVLMKTNFDMSFFIHLLTLY